MLGLFASAHNAKLPVFYSRFWNDRSAGVDAFTADWCGKFGLFVPPVVLFARVSLQHAGGVLVAPLW